MARTSLARSNLKHQPARTIVSVLGIGFAILLMYLQLGFLGSVGDTATIVYGRLAGDAVVRSPEYLHAYDPRQVDASLLDQLRGMQEVSRASPLDLGLAKWQNPDSGEFRGIAVVGVDLDSNPLDIAAIGHSVELLRRPDQILVDRATRPDFGPADGARFGRPDIGRVAEVNGRRVRIVGTFEMGTGLAANGAMLTSREGWLRVGGGDETGVSLIVLRFAPGLDRRQATAAVRERLRGLGGESAHAEVLTIEEAIRWEKRRWYLQTPVGLIFAMGVALSVVVGGVICYMVLAADVIAHRAEYATLKAIGYGESALAGTLLAQASYLAALALPPATLAALALYRLTSALAGIPIRMTWQWLLLVACLAFAMCTAAGRLAVRKLAKAEPASLF